VLIDFALISTWILYFCVGVRYFAWISYQQWI